MLNITGMNRFYYIRNFTDMRCKYSRILAVIRHQFGREPERDDITYKIDLGKDSPKIDLKVQMSDGYNAYTFLDGELEKTDHLICMAHARVKFEKIYQHGDDAVAKEFADMISELYDLEDGYGMRGLSAEYIWTERQGNHTKDIVRRIRKRLDEELSKDNEFRSSYIMQALNYLDNFWIILNLGSNEAAEMSAVYHSIISTLKLCGKSVWNFFGDYFRCKVLGLDTYKEYLPALS